jgi:Family of unknown function (DUF6161)
MWIVLVFTPSTKIRESPHFHGQRKVMAMTDENETKNESAPFVLGPSIFTGEGRGFQDIQEAKEWANREIQNLPSALGGISGKYGFLILRKPFESIIALGTEPDEIDPSTKQLQSILKSIESGNSFTDHSKISQYIKKAFQFSNEERAGYFCAIFNIDQIDQDEPLPHLSHPQHRTNFTNGYIYAVSLGLASQSGLLPSRGLIDSALKEIDGLVSKATNQLAQTSSQIKKTQEDHAVLLEVSASDLRETIESHERNLKEAQDKYNEERERIISGYKEFTALHDTVKYWTTQAIVGYVAAALGLVVFAGLGWKIVSSLLSDGPTMLQTFLSVIDDFPEVAKNPFAYIGFLSVPTIIVLWALKFPARIFKEQLHKANDALHRRTIIKTYLSLLRDESNPISRKERAYALSSIFGVPGDAMKDDTIPLLEDIVGKLNSK